MLARTRASGPIRRRLGAALIATLIVGGALAAHAAAPAFTPASLPSQVAGVIGSGDKLSLRLTGSDGALTVAVGEVIADGWVLSALTPDVATLSKDGQTRQVGLNPTGALASAGDARPSSVTVAGDVVSLQQAASLMLQVANANDLISRAQQTNNSFIASGTALTGLNVDDTRRFFEMSNKIEQRKVEIRQGLAPPLPFFTDDLNHPGDALINAVLGPDAAAYHIYLDAIDDSATIGVQRAERANNPVTGPSTYYLPAGANRAEVLAQAGVDFRGTWVPGPLDASGGQTFTRVSDLAGPQQSRDFTQVQAALREADAIAGGADPAQYGLTAAGAANLMATLPASVRQAVGR